MVRNEIANCASAISGLFNKNTLCILVKSPILKKKKKKIEGILLQNKK